MTSLSVYPAQDQATWIGACDSTGLGACTGVDKTAVSNWNFGVMTNGNAVSADKIAVKACKIAILSMWRLVGNVHCRELAQINSSNRVVVSYSDTMWSRVCHG